MNEDDIRLANLIRKDGRYTIPVSWTIYSTVEVEADNLEDALNRAREAAPDLPLGSGEYLDESYRIGSGEDAAELFSETEKLPFRGVLLKRDGSVERGVSDI